MTNYLAQQKLSLRTLFWMELLTMLVCSIANVAIRSIAVTFFNVSALFQPLQIPTIIISTIVYLLLAVGVFIPVSRTSRHPTQTFRIVAGVCLLVSLLFPLMALTGVFPTQGMNVQIFWSMIAMHIVSAIIVIFLLPRAAARI